MSTKALQANPAALIKILSEVLVVEPEAPYLKALPAKHYLSYKRDDLRVFCLKLARYGIPTQELISYLNDLFIPYRDPENPNSILEIGAGNGDFSYHLKIKGTDSAVQATPEMALYYQTLGQQPIVPPSTIERIDGVEAVRKYRPRVVFASWVTQKFDSAKGDVEGQAQAFVDGVDEEEIFALGIKKYVLVGNLDQHSRKRIMKYPHRELSFPWLVSRAANQCNNRMWVWDL